MQWDRDRIERAVAAMNAKDGFRVSGELRVLVIAAIWEYLDRRRSEVPLYRVDEWNETGGGIRRTLGTAAEFAIAIAAYEASVIRLPGANITLRTGARVVRSTEDDARQRGEE